MKILVYLEKSDVRGGIEIFAERQVARLRAEGHEVDVASDIRQEMGRYDEIIVHKCSDVATLEKFPPEKTVYYVHDHEPICPRTYAYTPLKRNCTRAGGLWPCIFCAPLCRNWKGALRRVLSQSRRKRAMAGFKKLVVISEFMKGRLVANGIPAEKIVVESPKIESLRVGIGSDRVADSTPTLNDSTPTLNDPNPTLNDPNHAFVDLLYVGQLIRGKGVQLLLAAMARMKAPRTLDIVGTGNMEPKLKALAAELGIADRVRFNGFRKNPQDWMRAARCVVVPSFWQEPYGLVAAEAVALGRPVVAFAIGGLPEACGGKATLVPPGDIAALAKALENT
jgi:glycosyltransferase involved in cell wall biosynthesis